ncbi:MAG: 50S ribosomal protein L5 [Planctomycetes bacterium]|nr:50S ribosomal protein L5 [Planctomycetota bacterium]
MADDKTKAAKPAKAPKGGGGGGKAIKGDFKAKPRKKKEGKPTEPAPPPRLKKHYETVVRAGLKKQFGYEAEMAVPRVTKVVVSMGIGDANENPRKLEALLEDLETATGQRPLVTRARLSVANFKLRQGMPVGLKVTLRGPRMWEFLDRLITLVVPRLRDFRGLSSKSFDGRGNYAMGLPDQLVFPEVRADKVEFYNGMNIVVCTTARTDDEARETLRLVGLPFVNLPVQIIQ